MGRIGKKMGEDAKPENGKAAPPPALPPKADEDYEDGDISTPKQDRYGTDDEPLE